MTTNALKQHAWKPGQCGNPGGRPRVPDGLRHIASLSQAEVCKIVSKYARMTRDELQTALTDAKTPMLEITVASIFAQSAKRGDYTRLAFLLDRSIGKTPVAKEDEDTAMRNDLKALSNEELIKFAREVLPQLEKAS